MPLAKNIPSQRNCKLWLPLKYPNIHAHNISLTSMHYMLYYKYSKVSVVMCFIVLAALHTYKSMQGYLSRLYHFVL